MTDSAVSAREAYEALAAHYDFFTAAHDYEAWTTALEALLHDHGAQRGSLLDVACGTGKSFLPMHRRGWRVTGCDLSPGMVREAARKAPGVRLAVCDMCSLPRFGEFDVVWCLDDALNYLLDGEQLAAALRGMRRNLKPGGVLLFDLNTLATYRGFFASDVVVPASERVVIWEGGCDAQAQPGVGAEATVTAWWRRPDGGWARSSAVHRQRHHPPADVSAALDAAGCEPLAVYGQGLDGRPSSGLDELQHTKAIYVARAAGPVSTRREVSRSDPHRAPGSPRRVGRIHPEGQLTAAARGAA